MKSPGTLYIVATPIGNLADLTLRCIEVLTKVEVIACEDTRHTGLLLKYIQNLRVSSHPELVSGSNEMLKRVQHDTRSVKPTLLSYYEQNELQRIPQILNVLKNGIDVALVSDSGTPTISDPGFKLVRECIREGIKVESIPGPSSVISAFIVSGLPTDKFLFLGYPPKKPGHRKKFFQSITTTLDSIKVTVILFEAPHKLIRTLNEIKNEFGDIDIVICRELTKVHEEIRRESTDNAINHFSKTSPKGEFAILFNLAN